MFQDIKLCNDNFKQINKMNQKNKKEQKKICRKAKK